MKRKRQQNTQTITCSGCGTKNVVLSSMSPSPASWINYEPRQMGPEEIAATVVPLKHARDIAIPAGFFVAVMFALPDPSLSFQARALGGGLAVGLGVFIVVRTVAAVKNWEYLGWKWEQMFNIDQSRGRIVHEPQPDTSSSVTTSIEVEELTSRGKLRRIVRLDWPCKSDDIPKIAQRLLNNKLAEADWGKGKTLSVPKFKIVRKSLIDKGYGRWKGRDRSLGWELTPVGRIFLGSSPRPQEEPGITNPPTPPPHS